MTADLTPQEKFNAESPERMVPRALLQGRPRDEVVADLIRLDWSRRAAEALVARVARDVERFGASPESRAALVRECRTQMIVGLLMVFCGLLVSALSALVVVAGLMEIWVLFGGIILVGFVLANRGYSRWRLYRAAEISLRDDDR